MVLRVCGAAQRWCDVILTNTCIVLWVVTLLFIYYAEACSATLYKASRLVFTDRLRPRSECPQFGMPGERRAQFRVPKCPDPEFPKALHSEFMSTPNVEFLNVPLCSAPISYLAGSKWGRPLCYGHAAWHWCLKRAHSACGGRITLDGGFASILALWR